MLKQQGFSASAVCNGKEALEYLMAAANGEHAVPNIILMDVQMPVMDGYQATQTIRTQGSFRDWPQIRNIPIIGVSEFETECDREKCVASGMDDFLSKPLEFESLEKTLLAWATVGERDLATPSNFRQARKHAGRPNCFPGHVGPSQSSQVPPTPPYLPAFGFPNNLQSQFTPMETPRDETEYPFPYFEAEPNFIGETSFMYPRNGPVPAPQSEADQARATAKASLAGILSPETTQRRSTKGKQKQSELPSAEELYFDVESWFTSDSITFRIVWDLVKFVETQLPSAQDLELVLTVSGTAESAFATICGDYVEKVWPKNGMRVIRTLILALQGASSSKQLHGPGSPDNYQGCTFSFMVGDVYTTCNAQGPREDLIQLAQQLLWLSAVFRLPEEGKLLSSSAKMLPSPTPGVLDISTDPTSLLSGITGTCWFGMFEGFVLAKGFWVPEREEEPGVEISFDAMILLGLIWYPCKCRGKLFLKGDTTALIPVSRGPAHSIQWHFLQSEDEESLISWDVIKDYAELMVDISDVEDLATQRAFVGYFSNAKIHLGTRDSGFRNIQLSGAEFNDERKLRFGNEYTGNIGTSGLGFLGVGISAKMVVHHTANRRIQAAQNRILQRIINARRLPTLLFDFKSKRAWLVPQLSVILHLVLAWAFNQEDADDLQGMIPYADADCDGGEAAYRAMKSAMDTQLPERFRTNETTTFSQLLTEFFAYVTQITDQQMGSELKEDKDLVGYEFRNIAELQQHVWSRRAHIDAESSAGWLKLVASRPDIPILFCSNLTDPIRPSGPEDTGDSSAFTEAARGQYFLTASIKCIEHLSEQCGGSGTLKLYNGLYCVPGANNNDGQGICKADHSPCHHTLFEISNHPPKEAPSYPDSGAVTIGRVSSKLTKASQKPTPPIQKFFKKSDTQLEKSSNIHPVVTQISETRKEFRIRGHVSHLSSHGAQASRIPLVVAPNRRAEPYSMPPLRPGQGAACTPPPDPYDSKDAFPFYTGPQPDGSQRARESDEMHSGFGSSLA